jgi:hypothetical protein
LKGVHTAAMAKENLMYSIKSLQKHQLLEKRVQGIFINSLMRWAERF